MRLPFRLHRVRTVFHSYLTDAGRTAVTNLSWLIVCTILAQIASIVVLLLLTKGLGQTQYGILSFALALQAYLQLLGSGGARASLIREGTRHPNALDQTTTSYLCITGIGSLLVCVVTLLVIATVPISAEESWFLTLITLGTIPSCMSLQPLFDLHHKQARAALIRLAGELLGLTGIVALYLADSLQLSLIGTVYAGKWITIAIGEYLAYHYGLRRLHLDLKVQNLLDMASSGWPLLLSSLVAMIPINAGVLLVRSLRGEADTAVMGLAQQIATGYLGIAMLATRVVQPHIAGPYGFHRGFILKLILFFTLFLGGLAVGVSLAGFLLLWVVLDPVYRAATGPMMLLLAGTAIIVAGVALNHYLVQLRAERTILMVNLIRSFLYLFGCFLLVPLFSYTGAAAMTLTVALVGTGLGVFLALNRFRKGPSAASSVLAPEGQIGLQKFA